MDGVRLGRNPSGGEQMRKTPKELPDLSGYSSIST